MGLMKRMMETRQSRGTGGRGSRSMMRVSSLFFDRRRVMDAVERAQKRNLGRMGAYVRRRARSSLKYARQKKVSELTDRERQRYEDLKAHAMAKGLPRPRRPEITSRPGEPPRLHRRSNLGSGRNPLKGLIFFSYSPASGSVVVGPIPFGKRGVSKLEHGGGGYRPRPFMRPAMHEELDQMPTVWRDSIKDTT